MYERNPWEIDVGSGKREVPVSESLSYQESNVPACRTGEYLLLSV